MPAIRSAKDIAEKWARVTPGRSADFQQGVQNPKRDWAQSAAGSEEAWASGVQQAISDKRYGRGVAAAGTAKWQRKTLEVGVPRWPQGVSAAKDDFEAGFAPYVELLSRISLPPRGPKGDPQNIERVRVIATALHELKTRKGR